MTVNFTPTIVTVNTTVTAAPAPSTLQQSGALVSAGGTTLSSNGVQYCSTLSQVSSILAAPLALASLTWTSGTVTATTSAAMTLATTEVFTVTIAGAVPAGFNGTYTATVTGSTTFTFPLSVNPGSETTPGTYTPPTAAHILDAATTFFAQGNSVGVSILELGSQTGASASVAALTSYITNHAIPQPFYAYLLPAAWDYNDSSGINTLAQSYSSPSGQTYFFVTSSTGTVSAYAGTKSVFAVLPSPTQGVTEVQVAAAFYQWLVNNPGAANSLAPMGFRYLYGVTPWSPVGNQSTLQTILTEFGNVVYAGSEGGISTATLRNGTTMDGTQASQWYGIDWFRIGVKQDLAATIINGSNQNPPLLYNQNGINALLAVAQQRGNNAVAFGCAQSVVITAVPFATYIAQNPGDYSVGAYNGLQATLVGQNGFLTITFNLNAVQFAA